MITARVESIGLIFGLSKDQRKLQNNHLSTEILSRIASYQDSF